jgi:hypothetical protein
MGYGTGKAGCSRAVAVVVIAIVGVGATPSAAVSGAALRAIVRPRTKGAPPRPSGYFHLRSRVQPSALPGDARCARRIRRSSWEPRPQNRRANGTIPRVRAVASAFAIRPRSRVDETYRKRWDRWLLPRVDGDFTGTTDEMFQWAACKWGLSDNMLRAIAVRESTWYQYLTRRDGTCVVDRGCGDIFTHADAASRTYCAGLANVGHHDYQPQFGGAGLCPKTFSIVGVMAWDDPAWEAPARRWRGNQNGTFPFSRSSTAFAVDYLASYLRGCYEGWITWLHPHGGDIWGCVGSWYSGGWHTRAANRYIKEIRSTVRRRPWLRPRFASAG